MLGLLIKDLKLLKNQKTFIFTLLIISCMFLMTDFGINFVLGYLTFMGAMLVVSTISMDDYNEGMSFLMALPIKRQDYVQEKYMLSLMIAIFSWLCGLILSLVGIFVKNMPVHITEHILTSLIILCLALILVSILIPVQMKFGQTRSSVAIMIICGILFLVGYGIYTVILFLGFDVNMLLNFLNTLNQTTVTLFIFVVMLIVEMISYAVSMGIIKSKEF